MSKFNVNLKIGGNWANGVTYIQQATIIVDGRTLEEVEKKAISMYCEDIIKQYGETNNLDIIYNHYDKTTEATCSTCDKCVCEWSITAEAHRMKKDESYTYAKNYTGVRYYYNSLYKGYTTENICYIAYDPMYNKAQTTETKAQTTETTEATAQTTETTEATAQTTEATAQTTEATAQTTEATAQTTEATAQTTEATAQTTGETAPPTGETAPPTGETAPPTGATAPPTASTAPPTGETAPPTAATAPPTGETAPPTAATAPPTGETPPIYGPLIAKNITFSDAFHRATKSTPPPPIISTRKGVTGLTIREHRQYNNGIEKIFVHKGFYNFDELISWYQHNDPSFLCTYKGILFGCDNIDYYAASFIYESEYL